MEAAATLSPGPLSTGRDSPVRADSSTAELPSTMTPSTGMDWPGRTTTRSPTRTSSTGISTSAPSRRTRGGLGGQVHQAGDGLGGLALGAGLQELAQGDEGEDHAGGLEVQVHMVLLHPGHVPVAQAVADLVDGKDAVDHSGGGAHGDERVHVGAAVAAGS